MAGLVLVFSLETARATKVLTLNGAIRTALTTSPRIKENQALLRGAVSGRKAVRAGLFPQVNGYARYDRLSDPVSVVPIQGLYLPPPLFSRDQYQAGLSLRVPLYEGGRLRSVIRAAIKDEGVARAGLAYARETLIAAVTDTFNSLLYLKALRRAREKTLAAIEETRKETALRLRLGRIAPLDLMEIDTQAASERLDLVRTRETGRRAGQQLCRLMGWSPATVIETRGSLEKNNRAAAKLAASLTGPEGSGRVKAYIGKRPDIIQAGKMVEKADESLAAARGLRLPNVELVGDYGRHAGSGFDGGEGRWSAGIRLSLNIFNGGLISAKEARARAKRDAAAEALKRLTLKAESQVYAALSLLREAGARIALAGKARITAAEAYKIETLRYRNGTGTVTDLLKTQAAWWQAKAQYIRALFDRQQAVTALRLAVGVIRPAEAGGGPLKLSGH
ncbi:MAG: TolC family protein [Deltaproteobacteria bacterium]|nr:TolC family protein [Deltaproteobacteria bacterium]